MRGALAVRQAARKGKNVMTTLEMRCDYGVAEREEETEDHEGCKGEKEESEGERDVKR